MENKPKRKISNKIRKVTLPEIEQANLQVNTGPSLTKINSEVKLARLKELQQELYKGTQRFEILSLFSNKWGISEESVAWYIGEYYAALKKEWSGKEFATTLFSLYMSGYSAAIKDGNYSEAKKFLDSLTKFLPKEQIDLSADGSGNITIKFNFLGNDDDRS